MDLPSGYGVPTYAHWQGILVTMPDGRTALVIGFPRGPDSQLLMVQPGTYGEAWAADGSAAVEVDGSVLTPVLPSKKDRVKILGDSVEGVGPSGVAPAGAVGTLIGIDNNEGIVKVDRATELAIADMSLLGKVVA